MANIYSTTSDYWIKPGALTISLNALDNPQYLQSSVLSGAVIMAFKLGVIEYDSSHNYRKWNLIAENTFFHNSEAKYVYARLDRKEDKTQALIVYSNEKLDIVGRTVSEEDVEEDPLYFYIYLGSITASVNNDGNSIPRVWDDVFKTGELATDKTINEETLGEWNKMFRLNKVINAIEVLKDIFSANIQTLFLGKRKVEIADVQVSENFNIKELINDKTIPTSKLLNLAILKNNEELKKEFLSKLHPDRALESISFAQPSTFESGFHSRGVSLFEEGATVRQPLVVSTEIRSETFAENATGFRGGADGHFEMQSLKVNEFLQTQELRKNRITVNGNEFWFTDSMLVGAVTQLADSDHYLVDARKLTDNYQISFRSSDILKGIYSYETGFKTCFLKVITVNDSLESMHVVSLNHQAPMPNMVLARKSNEVDPDRQASIYADGLNGQLKVLDGYDPDNLSAERVIALLGKLDHFSHPAFPQGFERSGLFAQNVYLIGKFIQRSWDDQYQPNPFWKGLFKEGIQYGEYDLVRWFKPMYGESTYLCKKKPPVGTLPSDGRYWELYIPAGMPAYTYTVFSTKGKSFVAQTLFEEKELTTLFLKVMMGQWDLTAEVPDSAVFWTRESEDPLSDQAWNAANLKYGKQIPIRNTDLNAPSVRFYANIDDSFLNN